MNAHTEIIEINMMELLLEKRIRYDKSGHEIDNRDVF